MCLTKTPEVKVPDPVTPPQETKQPESSAAVDTARKNAAANAGVAGSTWLTGATGIERSQLNLGKSTILGA